MSSEDISEHKDDTAVEAVANDYDDADVYIAVESDDDLWWNYGITAATTLCGFHFLCLCRAMPCLLWISVMKTIGICCSKSDTWIWIWNSRICTRNWQPPDSHKSMEKLFVVAGMWSQSVVSILNSFNVLDSVKALGHRLTAMQTVVSSLRFTVFRFQTRGFKLFLTVQMIFKYQRCRP